MAGVFRAKYSLIERARASLAIQTGRALTFLLRRLGRGATSLPGKVALSIDPRLLSRLTAGRTVYLVTGTNGKTTTVRILCAVLEALGTPVITNPSGANLDSGLTTTLIDHLPLLRRKTVGEGDVAIVFEIDEAFFAKCARSLQPTICVVTNFFRDQLDRYGELAHTRDLIARGLDDSDGHVILCADDSLCASLAQGREARCSFFGLDLFAMHKGASGAVTESAYCTFCGTRYDYQAHAYGHLGDFACSHCGFKRPEPTLTFAPVVASPESSASASACSSTSPQPSVETQLLDFNFAGSRLQAELAIPGLHNAYNASAALLAAITGGQSFAEAAGMLEKARAAFGRMERFKVGTREVCLILVKNPVGMDRALDFVSQAKDYGAAMLLLNANDPDGRDVSWIWDVDFERTLLPGQLAISGIRAADLALRLHYAGKQTHDLITGDDMMALFDRQLALCPPNHCLYILPNYTAMLDLRAQLAKRYNLRAFWRKGG
ncbi:MAG: MurT ligase domain-containing protein [Eubacteriales bacterium]|nr:MurT ligase domain-containing protein [Eubacteriales bacterium]